MGGLVFKGNPLFENVTTHHLKAPSNKYVSVRCSSVDAGVCQWTWSCLRFRCDTAAIFTGLIHNRLTCLFKLCGYDVAKCLRGSKNVCVCVWWHSSVGMSLKDKYEPASTFNTHLLYFPSLLPLSFFSLCSLFTSPPVTPFRHLYYWICCLSYSLSATLPSSLLFSAVFVVFMEC